MFSLTSAAMFIGVRISVPLSDIFVFDTLEGLVYSFGGLDSTIIFAFFSAMCVP